MLYFVKINIFFKIINFINVFPNPLISGINLYIYQTRNVFKLEEHITRLCAIHWEAPSNVLNEVKLHYPRYMTLRYTTKCITSKLDDCTTF